MAGERTEAATPKRRQDVRKRGQTSRSADLTGALVLLAGIYAVKLVAGGVEGQISGFLQSSFVLAGDSVRTGALPSGMSVLSLMAGILPPLIGAMALTAIGVTIAQGGFVFAPGLLSPKFERINPLAGAKRLLSPQGLLQFLKTMAKFGAVAGVTITTIKSHDSALAQAGTLELSDSVRLLLDLLWQILFNAVLVMCAIGALDWLWERRRFLQSIRMTKQEVKEEMRQSEGDPHVRAQLRRRRVEFMQQLMAAVKKADVVVTNPTHFAVALQYDETSMAAPTVVAKGQDFLAQTLKDAARDAGVPVLENPPLARALYRSVAVGKPIPPELYVAVAEVLAFVYKLKRKLVGAT
jgi:flagellar biosynthetic protein FlhB